MSLYKTYGTSTDIEKDGIEVDYGDTRFLLARAGGSNAQFRKVLQFKTEPHRRKIDSGTLPETVGRRLLAEAYAEAVIKRVDVCEVDSEGEPVLVDGEKNWTLNQVPLEDGSMADATKENVVKLLLNLPELFADIQEMASTYSNFRAEEAEEDAGN